MKKTKSMVMGAAVLAALALPMVAGAANKLVVRNAGDTADAAVVADTGYIGVGTSVPDASLHIKATGLFPANVVKVEGNEVNKGAGIVAYSNRSDAQLSRSGDRLGFIFFGSNTGGTLQHPAGFAANAESDWTASSWPTYFAFQTTASGSTTRTEHLRLTGDGRLRLTNQPAAPANNATCTAGDLILDAAGGYLYLCTATNSWKRAAFGSY